MEGARVCSYSITGIEHLIHHATCLINILHTASASQMSPGRQIMSFNEHIPWLVDSLEELNEEQKRWRHHCQYSPLMFLEFALNLARSSPSLNDLVLQKLYTIIVLISADVAEHPEGLIGPEQNTISATNTLALSLAHLAGAVIRKRPIAKIVAAKLLKPLEHFSMESGISEDIGDLAVRRSLAPLLTLYLTPAIQRSIRLLQEAVSLPINRYFSAEIVPNAFVDSEIRSRVKTIEPKFFTATRQERSDPKRRKITKETSTVPFVRKRLCQLLGVPSNRALVDLEEAIL